MCIYSWNNYVIKHSDFLLIFMLLWNRHDFQMIIFAHLFKDEVILKFIYLFVRLLCKYLICHKLVDLSLANIYIYRLYADNGRFVNISPGCIVECAVSIHFVHLILCMYLQRNVINRYITIQFPCIWSVVKEL